MPAMLNRPLSLVFAVLLAALATPARPDTVETKNGARLVGKVAKIDDKTITLTTDYAGTLTIKKSEVTRLQTDAPQFIRLADGTMAKGTITPLDSGKIEIHEATRVIGTSLDRVTATWDPGSKDPQAARWTFEASADITGKTGNREEFGSALSARAKRIGQHDTLQFYTAYKYQRTDGVISADQFKAGLDYANNYSGRKSWYVRDESGFDRVKDIKYYDLAATGLGYDFVKKAQQILTGRAGLSFRYEDYHNPDTEDVKSFGLDLGLHHEHTFNAAKLVNDLTYMPAFDDYTNYRAIHESYYEVPLPSPNWKLRLGVTNDYTSRPGAGVERLDTTYFTRFVLNWK